MDLASLGVAHAGDLDFEAPLQTRRDSALPSPQEPALGFLVRQDGSGDATTIQGAIDLAYGPGGYRIIIGPGHYTENIVISDHGDNGDEESEWEAYLVPEIDGTVTISGQLFGPYRFSTLILDGLHFVDMQINASTSNTQIWRCIIEGTVGRPAITSEFQGTGDGYITMRDCLVRYNHNPGDGGAICPARLTALDVEDCRFIGNSSDSRGGAAFLEDSWFRFRDCLFVENHAAFGGAIATQSPTRGGALFNLSVVAFSTFYKNSADSAGAHILNSTTRPYQFAISACILSQGLNTAAYHHGGGVLPKIACTDIFDNEGGDWVGPIADTLFVNGNMSVSPQFCSPQDGIFDLSPGSPIHDHLPCFNWTSIGASDISECAQVYPPTDVSESDPSVSRGFHAQPNPSTGSVRFSIAPSDAAISRLLIHDMRGRLVRELAVPGGRSVVWDGLDRQGRPLSSGIYFARDSDSHTTTRIHLVR